MTHLEVNIGTDQKNKDKERIKTSFPPLFSISHSVNTFSKMLSYGKKK